MSGCFFLCNVNINGNININFVLKENDGVVSPDSSENPRRDCNG